MICEDEYYARIMGLAVDFLEIVKISEYTKMHVKQDLENQIASIEKSGVTK